MSSSIKTRSKQCLAVLEIYSNRCTGTNQTPAGKSLCRLNDWIDGIGVLAAYHHSLDYRLREAPRLAGALLDMLDVLEFQILQGTLVLHFCSLLCGRGGHFLLQTLKFERKIDCL